MRLSLIDARTISEPEGGRCISRGERRGADHDHEYDGVVSIGTGGMSALEPTTDSSQTSRHVR
jgi:hypothetical protein